jgi:signal transduction histidine kinase
VRLALSAVPPSARLPYIDVVVRDVARSLWAEPRAPNPPTRPWWDWALVAALIAAAVIETVVGEELVWQPVNLALVVVLGPALLWRRTHPLAVVALMFSSFIVVDVASIVMGVTWEGANTIAFALLLPYALFRWGSGREAALGLAVMMGAVLFSATDDNPVGNVVGGTFIVSSISALGAAVRYRSAEQLRGRDQAKLREREQLARELHDTVAHHVSAIAIQAQAGRTVAESRPEAVLDALAVVEKEASRALIEMRTIVDALRRDEQSDLAPQPGVADIERLARSTGDPPHVDVTLTGDLDDLPPSVDAALYRLAQESVTNALRHARHATHVHVVVTGDDDSVRLTVWDDGDARPAGTASSSGFGLLGMAERAKLLGGTLEAGPKRDQGWTVYAVLPRSGTAA